MIQVHWANPISGSFTNASDWSGGVVPGANDAAILDAAGVTLYTVTASANETVNSIQTAANATFAVTDFFVDRNGTGGGANAGVISVGNSATLIMDGAIDNTGSIMVTAGPGLTNLIFGRAGGATLSGGGEVMFPASSGNNYAELTGGVLTNVDNTITGDFAVLALNGFINDAAGVIDAIGADHYGSPAIYAETITNAGLIENTGLNRLSIEVDTTLNNSGGVILAGNGSIVDISPHSASNYRVTQATLVGGTLETSGTGVIYATYFGLFSGPLIFDGTTATVNIDGAVVVKDEGRLILDGTINDTDSLSLEGVFGATFVEVGGANAVLSGGGQVILGDNHFNAITGAAPGATLTNVDNTISGAGRIGAYGNAGKAFFLVNEAAGVVDANAAAGLVLDTGSDTVTNAGLIEGTGTGGLTIRNTTTDGSGGGVIAAGNGSHVGLQGATLIGGTLKSMGSGVFQTFAGANLLDGTASAVSNQALLVISDGTALTFQGAIDNTGRVHVSGQGTGAALDIGSSGGTLSGGGRITLSDTALNRIVGASSAATLTNVDNNLSGAGQLGAGSMTLINEAKGVIVGSQAAALIIDTGANTIVNAGIILSRGAGGVTIQSAVANSGLLETAGGELTVNGAVTGIGTGTIYSGTLDFTSSFSQRVVFQGTTGELELAQSQNYAGTITGFSKTGGTALDLRDIGFVSSTEATFAGTAGGGVLTVTDGTHTAHITLKGDYRASTFTASSDGHGGTIIVDPAASAVATHRFVAAAASFGAGGDGLASVAHEAWRAQPVMLARPGVMVA